MPDLETIRLDKWLWTTRFYKTRKLAAEAIAGGKVHLNGQRTKPGKEIKIGAKLTISKNQYSWEITITGINKHRRPAKEAILLFAEDPESFTKRQQVIALQREARKFHDVNQERKPNKKERRQIHRFKHQ